MRAVGNSEGQSCSLCPGPQMCSLHQRAALGRAGHSQCCQGVMGTALGCSGTSTGYRTATASPQQEQPPWQLGLAKERVPSIELRAFITFLSLHPWANMWLRICLYFQIWHQVRKALIKFNRTNMTCHQWGTNPMPKNTIFTDLASFNILKTSSLHGLIYHWAHLTEGIGTAPKMPIFPSLTV